MGRHRAVLSLASVRKQQMALAIWRIAGRRVRGESRVRTVAAVGSPLSSCCQRPAKCSSCALRSHRVLPGRDDAMQAKVLA